MLFKRRITGLQAAAAVLALVLVSLALAAPGRDLLIAFGGGASFAWLFMRLVAPPGPAQGDADADRAWQDTVPGPYQR